MKMDISDENIIVKDVIFQNISSKVKNIRTIEEFGCYKYFMSADENKTTFCFTCLDFESIYNYSGKEWIEKEFSGKNKKY